MGLGMRAGGPTLLHWPYTQPCCSHGFGPCLWLILHPGEGNMNIPQCRMCGWGHAQIRSQPARSMRAAQLCKVGTWRALHWAEAVYKGHLSICSPYPCLSCTPRGTQALQQPPARSAAAKRSFQAVLLGEAGMQETACHISSAALPWPRDTFGLLWCWEPCL